MLPPLNRQLSTSHDNKTVTKQTLISSSVDLPVFPREKEWVGGVRTQNLEQHKRLHYPVSTPLGRPAQPNEHLIIQRSFLGVFLHCLILLLLFPLSHSLERAQMAFFSATIAMV